MAAAPPNSVEILRLSDRPDHVATAAGWLFEQWGKDPLESYEAVLQDHDRRPAALLALSGGKPIGVVGFTRHQLEGQERDELWINVLYVITTWRKKGVGRWLVSEAVKSAREFGAPMLYVYTDVPRFYEKDGWQKLRGADEHGSSLLRHALEQV